MVTGAASGIGLVCAVQFVAQGAKVVLLDRQEQALDEALRQLAPAVADVLRAALLICRRTTNPRD